MRQINADDAIKAICDLPNCYNGFSDTYDKACIIGALEEVPTIDTVKHGKWINDKGLYKCSVCGELWMGWWAVACPEKRMYATMKFCPNCGAKMDGGEG